MIDKNELKRAIELFKKDELFEVRILGKYKSSGYFNNYETLQNELSKQNLDNAQVYITLNKIDDACYSRENKDHFVNNAKSTTDNNITRYNWLFIDLDPERPSGIASSNEELEIAKKKAKEIYEYLKNKGFKEPIIAMSGNGIHLLYKINIENNTENQKLIEKCLKALDMMFSETKIKVDTANYNPSRICKLYGTYAKKGANTIDRPHRLSKILYAKSAEENDIELLKQLANTLPKVEPIKQTGIFSIDDFLSRNGIRTAKVESTSSGTKYLLEECLFDSDHKCPDAMIFQYSNGGIAYKCFHNSCQNYTWEDVRNRYEPKENYEYKPKKTINPYETKLEETPKAGKVFNISDIKVSKHLDLSLSGIKQLDFLLGGFTYNCVTLWAAQTNAGKTTLLTMLANSLIKQGRPVMYFSGEQTKEDFKNNLFKQIVEKRHIQTFEYNNTGIKKFFVDDEETERLNNYFNEKLFVYDNENNRDIDSFIETMKELRDKHYCRDFIIDNLMQLDIRGNDLYREQERIAERLRTFASNFKCNVHLVAHSRKTNGNSIRLTMFDISGTQAIANKAYNIITLTRLDQISEGSEEYEKLRVDLAKNKYNIEECNAVVEVLKTKGYGTGLIGLKYDFDNKKYIEIERKNVDIQTNLKIRK